MPRFFVSPEQIGEKTLHLAGKDAWHIARALRMAVGQEITVSNMQGERFVCRLAEIRDEHVTADILAREPDAAEPPFAATLYQALPKGDKMGEIVEKAVECGVARIVPVLSARCVSRPDAKSFAAKRARWQKIAESAAKQSGRGIIPEIAPLVSLDAAVAELARADVALLCYEGERTTSLGAAIRARGIVGKQVGFLVGSEGGFSESEAASAVAAGVTAVGLGPRILRTETAAAFVLACLSYEAEL